MSYMSYTLNGARIKRDGGTIFIALPSNAWREIEGGCHCQYCKAGKRSVWDTLALPANPVQQSSLFADRAYTVHMPEFSQ
jgi:hypothetical protein